MNGSPIPLTLIVFRFPHFSFKGFCIIEMYHSCTRSQELSYQLSSAAQSCPMLCDPMDCSTPSFPVHHQLPELTQTPSSPSSQWCHQTISSSVVPFSSCLQSLPTSRSFPMSQFFPSGGQSIGASASASVLPMNIQDWFPWGLTGWIFLLSKGLWRVSYNTIVQKHQFFGIQPSL